MKRLPRANVSHARLHGLDPQEMMPSHQVDIPGGPVTIHHADNCFAGLIEIDGQTKRIAITIAQGNCDCGCGLKGLGFLFTPDTAAARLIASNLTRYADEIEAAARNQTDAALAKAREARS